VACKNTDAIGGGRYGCWGVRGGEGLAVGVVEVTQHSSSSSPLEGEME